MVPKVELTIGKFMIGSLLIAAFLVIFGGLLYLSTHALTVLQFTHFNRQPSRLDSMIGIIKSVNLHSPLAIVQFGILVLVIAQGLRVGLTAILFWQQKDYVFTLLSLFIFLILLATCIWKF